MRVERTLVGLLFAAIVAAPGCGRLAYNLPPAQRILEPGPGVGGPGPGVIPPAGYGMYGAGVGRFGDGAGSYMGGGGGAGGCYSGGPGAVPAPTPNGVMPAGYNGPTGHPGIEEGGPGGSCPSGPYDGVTSNRMNDPQVQQAGFHHMFGGGGGCSAACDPVRPKPMPMAQAEVRVCRRRRSRSWATTACKSRGTSAEPACSIRRRS